jgi:hypothetical protein
LSQAAIHSDDLLDPGYRSAKHTVLFKVKGREQFKTRLLSKIQQLVCENSAIKARRSTVRRLRLSIKPDTAHQTDVLGLLLKLNATEAPPDLLER